MVVLSTLRPSTNADPPSSATRPTIAIIGLGRVGMALGRAIHRAGYTIRAVSSRDPQKAEAAACTFGAEALAPAEAARSAELVLLTVSDDAISTVARELGAAGAWRAGQSVVHASGASPSTALNPAAQYGATIGAFHPLAAFATHDAILLPGITFAIEAPPPLHETLSELAIALNGHPLTLAPEDKTLYHAAAVIASNYTIALAALATEIFEQLGATGEQGLQALLPLMRTTLDNLERAMSERCGGISTHWIDRSRTLARFTAAWRMARCLWRSSAACRRSWWDSFRIRSRCRANSRWNTRPRSADGAECWHP
jgi:predicted short-subunit dehydrogenase-like oxidoreductase (DUF2520 family)